MGKAASAAAKKAAAKKATAKETKKAKAAAVKTAAKKKDDNQAAKTVVKKEDTEAEKELSIEDMLAETLAGDLTLLAHSDEDVIKSIKTYLGTMDAYFFDLHLSKQQRFIEAAATQDDVVTYIGQFLISFIVEDFSTKTFTIKDWGLLGFDNEDINTYCIARGNVGGDEVVELCPEEVKLWKHVNKVTAEPSGAHIAKLKERLAKDRERAAEQLIKNQVAAAEKNRRKEFADAKRQASNLQAKLSPVLLEMAAKAEALEGEISKEAASALQQLYTLQGVVQDRLVSDEPEPFKQNGGEMMSIILEAKQHLLRMKRQAR
jgi:hypothetical protein